MPAGVGQEFPGEHGGVCISEDEEFGVLVGECFDGFHARIRERDALRGGPFCIIDGKTVKSHFFYAKFLTEMEKLHAGRYAMSVSVFPGESIFLCPPAVPVGDDSNVFRDSHNQRLLSVIIPSSAPSDSLLIREVFP
jgi:hypothetical protein